MAFTSHGHHIPGTIKGKGYRDAARCGGVDICPRCKSEVSSAMAWVFGEPVDYQAKAKQLVVKYIDAKHKQTFPMTEQECYEVYVVWFSKTLQNWKALLSTTLTDHMYYELTYDGEKKATYLDAYKKLDSVPIPD